MKRLVMEFLGTFFFILTIVMTGNPFAIAAMLMAWVYIGGAVSGGHYNPLVSYAVALRHQLSWHDFFRYCCAQVLGSLAAFELSYFLGKAIAIPAPGPHISLMQAFTMETFLSFVFASTILAIASSSHYSGNYVFGLVIGGVIPALAFLGGPISGGLFNPALAIGANLFGFFKHIPLSLHHLVMYVGGAFLGAFLAVIAYNYFHEEERVY